jgi:hypothetical protein
MLNITKTECRNSHKGKQKALGENMNYTKHGDAADEG